MPHEASTGEPLVDAEHLAERLGVTERMIRELRYRREIPAVKVGRLVRYDPIEVLASLRKAGER